MVFCCNSKVVLSQLFSVTTSCDFPRFTVLIPYRETFLGTFSNITVLQHLFVQKENILGLVT